MNKIVINTDTGKHKIDRHIYGHFSEHLGRCIYDGYWVGEDSPIPNERGIRKDIVKALKKAKTPNMRWPGGCFADEYHWKDGIGPREERPTMINTHWGGVTENNHFGTHEFLDLCEQIGCEPYICGNVGSGTVQEMSQWVEYVNFDGVSPMANLRRENGRDKPWNVTFWGVGNENWGCGGNMRPEYYADLVRRYGCYCRNYPNRKLYKIACGPNGADYEWTDVLMRQMAKTPGDWTFDIDALTLHYYCVSGKESRSATKFKESDWFAQLQRALVMDELLVKHGAIMDRHDPEKRVAMIVDEWGTWHHVEPGTNPGFLYQQNSLRDALVAALNLDIFNRHCERVRMCNIAQTVNVLQAMILTEGEKMLLTPTYHVFEMYAVHQDATLLPMDIETEQYKFGDESIPAVSGSASLDGAGKVHITLSNTNPKKAVEVSIDVRGSKVAKVSGRVLTAPKMTAHNTFTKADAVKPEKFTGTRRKGNMLSVTMPSKSVVVLELS